MSHELPGEHDGELITDERGQTWRPVEWGRQYPILPEDLIAKIEARDPDVLPNGNDRNNQRDSGRIAGFVTPRGDNVAIYFYPMGAAQSDHDAYHTDPWGVRVEQFYHQGHVSYGAFGIVVEPFASLAPHETDLDIVMHAQGVDGTPGVELEDPQWDVDRVGLCYYPILVPAEHARGLMISFNDLGSQSGQ